MALFLQFVSVVIFVFGAPAFSVLALSCLWQRKRTSILFRTFTVICALAFLDNLGSAAFVISSPAINLVRALLVGILPPMMANLLLEQEPGPAPRRLWRAALALLYLAAISAALLSALDGQTPLSPFNTLSGFSTWPALKENSSQIVLAAVSIFSITMLALTRRERNRAERRQRLWNIALFSALLLSAVAASISDNPFFALVPDYVLLLFFAVRLYYTERIAFFDTFLKAGSYFAAGGALLTLLLLTVPPFANLFSGDWIHASLAVLALIPVWLAAPFLYSRIGRLTDLALHRRFSALDAERLFLQAAQTGVTERQLRDVAIVTLEDIFGCRAEVTFEGPHSTAAPDDLMTSVLPAGSIRLLARDNGVPFLSADIGLLGALAASLGVLLQNARLRAQQADQLRREQELAALASRAELRALRAQINPHFLFNALNAIAGWIRTEPEFADETVAQLAEVFRYTLQRSESEWVMVHEEVDFLRAYLAVERARFRDRLEVEIDVDPAADSVLIPAMVIQPVVENAIKHGASLACAKGRVILAIRRQTLALLIEVRDNGPGFPPGFALHNAGLGLRNVAERLRAYNGSLQWENQSAGTCVKLEIRIGEKS